jgi:prepilin-type N-terminal cleavage/methylation domain-containing protein
MNKWNAKVDNVNKAQFKIRGSPPHVACRRRNGGFSLVEVLISMTIFAIAVLGLAIGAGSVMRANQTSYFSTIAVNLGQDKLEELKANPASLAPGGPVTDTVDGVVFTRNWTTGTLVAGVTQIDVTVSWTDYTTHNVTVSSAVLN